MSSISTDSPSNCLSPLQPEYPTPVKTSPLESLEALARSLEVDMVSSPTGEVAVIRDPTLGSAVNTISPLVQPNQGLIEAGISPLQSTIDGPTTGKNNYNEPTTTTITAAATTTTTTTTNKIGSLASSIDSLGTEDIHSLHNRPSSVNINYSMLASDYRLGPAIGHGSSAIVYHATYLPSGQAVAVKMIDLDHFERDQIDELRREIQVMSLCKHLNLLRVLVSFVHESKLWIVTPFLSGGSCLDIMRANPQFREGLEEGVLATILVQALRGLAYLHRTGHIHRDFKAGNLLMDGDGTVQLADFGVTASLGWGGGVRFDGDKKGRIDIDHNNHDKKLTLNESGTAVRKTFVGTPCWMAPEVMEMTRGYDQKADIWSFGITALELAQGQAPFSRFPPMKIIYKTLGEPPPTLDRKRARHRYSKALKGLIDECLKKDPRERPTAEQLLRHPFFKVAVHKKSYLVSQILDRVPPLLERPRVQKLARRLSENQVINEGDNQEGNQRILPNDTWDFSSDNDDEQSKRAEKQNEEDEQVDVETSNLASTDYSSSSYRKLDNCDDEPEDLQVTIDCHKRGEGSEIEEIEGENIDENGEEGEEQEKETCSATAPPRNSRFVVETGLDSSRGDSTADLHEPLTGEDANTDHVIDQGLANIKISNPTISRHSSSRSSLSRASRDEKGQIRDEKIPYLSQEMPIGDEGEEEEQEGIRKGRFSVLESANALDPSDSGPLEGDKVDEGEEGRQSRFQIVEAALGTFTAAAAAATAVLEKERDRLATDGSTSTTKPVLLNGPVISGAPSRFHLSLERDQEQEMIPDSVLSQEEILPNPDLGELRSGMSSVQPPNSSFPNSNFLHPSQFDQLLMTIDILRSQIVELRTCFYQQQRQQTFEYQLQHCRLSSQPSQWEGLNTLPMTGNTSLSNWNYSAPPPTTTTASTTMAAALAPNTLMHQFQSSLQPLPPPGPLLNPILGSIPSTSSATATVFQPYQPAPSVSIPQFSQYSMEGGIPSVMDDPHLGQLTLNMNASPPPPPPTQITLATNNPTLAGSLHPNVASTAVNFNNGLGVRSYSTDQSINGGIGALSSAANPSLGLVSGTAHHPLGMTPAPAIMSSTIHHSQPQPPPQQPHHHHHQHHPSSSNSYSLGAPLAAMTHSLPASHHQHQHHHHNPNQAQPQHRYMNSLSSPSSTVISTANMPLGPPTTNASIIGPDSITEQVLLMKRELEVLKRENVELRKLYASPSTPPNNVVPALPSGGQLHPGLQL